MEGGLSDVAVNGESKQYTDVQNIETARHEQDYPQTVQEFIHFTTQPDVSVEVLVDDEQKMIVDMMDSDVVKIMVRSVIVV